MAQVSFAILAGIVPALFWLWFWLHEDKAKPEPKALIGEVFILGCLVVIPAYFLEKFFNVNNTPLFQNNLLTLFLFWAIIEETLKYLAVYWGSLRTRFYDEPVDAMIYMITGALGFAAVENTLFILSALQTGASGSLEYLLTGNYRFLGATLVHIVASAIIGGIIGLTFYSRRLKKVIYLCLGLATAIILHALFNYSIIKSDSDQVFKIFALLWFAGVIIIFLFERVKQTITQQHRLSS